VPVRLDGKTIRGEKDDEGNQRHLLAALVGPEAATSVIAAQAEVGARTNEVPMAQIVPARQVKCRHGRHPPARTRARSLTRPTATAPPRRQMASHRLTQPSPHASSHRDASGIS
jgi:hypothetical protein